jgi:hypothetical protein
MLAATETSSRSSLPSSEGRYVVLAASDPTVASRAGASRLLQTELQVYFMVFIFKQLREQPHVAL